VCNVAKLFCKVAELPCNVAIPFCNVAELPCNVAIPGIGDVDMKHLLTAIFICTISVFCMASNGISSTNGPDEGWRSVATVNSTDGITHTHVHSLLKSQGIECTIEGSVVYDVSVPEKKYAQAVKLLKQDLKKRHYEITIYVDGKDIKHTIPKKMWRKSTPKKTHQELIGLESYGPTTDIGALLRSPEVRKKIVTFPYVVCIKSLERRYLNPGGREKIGHDFEIEFAVSLDEESGGKRLYCQVWDEGKQIQVWGSNEWGQTGSKKQ
jgi:hypothetical protein